MANDSIFKGDKGRWLIYECVPPYLLAIFIWPALYLFNDVAFFKSFFTTFASGDFFAITICFLIPVWLECSKVDDVHLKGGGFMLAILFCSFLYFGVKVKPPLIPIAVNCISDIPMKTGIVTVCSWLSAIFASLAIYKHKESN